MTEPRPALNSGDTTREVLRRARAQDDLETPLSVTADELEALRRFGVQVDHLVFWCGTAPGWQRFEVKP